MNILIVSNLYPPYIFGGYEILCHQMVRELEERGHQIHVLTSNYGLDFAPVEPEAKITRTLALTTSFPKPGEDVGFVDFRLASIEKIARTNFQETQKCLNSLDYKIDLVFCWCLNRLSPGSIFAARKNGIPIVYTINDEHPKQFKFSKKPRNIRQIIRYIAEKTIYPMSTLRNAGEFPITIISKALKNSLISQGLPIENSEVIYQGIPVNKMKFSISKFSQNERFKILYAGQVSKAKGIHTIIKAITLIKKQQPEIDIGLTVVGSGVPQYRLDLDKLVQEGNLEKVVEFTGKVPHQQLEVFHHNHHCFVFSSEWEEPFGLTHLEAMAYGNPVISTTTGGSAELIKDKVNALAYSPGDPVQLAEKILLLHKNEEFRNELSHSARKYVESHHSFSGYVNQIEDFLIKSTKTKVK